MHALRLLTNRTLFRYGTDWCHRGECTCGADSGLTWRSRKAIKRWYQEHKEEEDPSWFKGMAKTARIVHVPGRKLI